MKPPSQYKPGLDARAATGQAGAGHARARGAVEDGGQRPAHAEPGARALRVGPRQAALDACVARAGGVARNAAPRRVARNKHRAHAANGGHNAPADGGTQRAVARGRAPSNGGASRHGHARRAAVVLCESWPQRRDVARAAARARVASVRNPVVQRRRGRRRRNRWRHRRRHGQRRGRRHIAGDRGRRRGACRYRPRLGARCGDGARS